MQQQKKPKGRICDPIKPKHEPNLPRQRNKPLFDAKVCVFFVIVTNKITKNIKNISKDMEKVEFEKCWTHVSKLRGMFPYWTEKTFTAYCRRNKLPFPVKKIGGRLFCSNADIEAWRKAHPNY